VDIDLQMGKECRFIPWDQRGKYPSPLESRWYPAHMKSRRLYLAWQQIKEDEGIAQLDSPKQAAGRGILSPQS